MTSQVIGVPSVPESSTTLAPVSALSVDGLEHKIQAACASLVGKPFLLSHTGATTLTRCPFRFALEYRLCLRAGGVAEAPAIGTCAHSGCEAMRATGAIDAALHAAEAEAMRLYPEGGEAYERVSNMAAVLVGGYAIHLFRADLRSVHSEVGLCWPLAGRCLAKGRADGVVFRIGKPALLYELKTTAETLDAKEAELRCSYQLPLYAWLLERQRKVKVAGAVVEILKKPVKAGEGAVKKGTAESWQEWRVRVAHEYAANPDRYFRRINIPRKELDSAAAVKDLRRVAAAIRVYDRGGYPRLRGQCSGPFGPCQYKHACWEGDLSRYEARPYEFDGGKAN